MENKNQNANTRLAILGSTAFKRGLCLLLFTVVSSLCWGQKVKVGYDKSADFGKFKTYAWAKQDVSARMPLVAAAIKAAVDEELTSKGLRKVDSDPDLLVSYQGGVDAKSAVAAQDPGYTASGGVPLPNSTMWSGSPGTSSSIEMQGTLAVDLVDARQDQLVWRGTAKAKLDTQHQTKVFDQANKAVTEMFKKYPPKPGS
jgi:hypothetical protein